MPLLPGSSRAVVSANIKTELAAGKPRRQAIAIALSEKRRTTGKGKKQRRTIAA